MTITELMKKHGVWGGEHRMEFAEGGGNFCKLCRYAELYCSAPCEGPRAIPGEVFGSIQAHRWPFEDLLELGSEMGIDWDAWYADAMTRDGSMSGDFREALEEAILDRGEVAE